MSKRRLKRAIHYPSSEELMYIILIVTGLFFGYPQHWANDSVEDTSHSVLLLRP